MPRYLVRVRNWFSNGQQHVRLEKATVPKKAKIHKSGNGYYITQGKRKGIVLPGTKLVVAKNKKALRNKVLRPFGLQTA